MTAKRNQSSDLHDREEWTECTIKGDGEDGSKMWNVTDGKNEYSLKVEQPGVGMVFKWKTMNSILKTLRGGQMHGKMERCILQMGIKSPSTDCLPGWGRRFTSLQPQRGA